MWTGFSSWPQEGSSALCASLSTWRGLTLAPLSEDNQADRRVEREAMLMAS